MFSAFTTKGLHVLCLYDKGLPVLCLYDQGLPVLGINDQVITCALPLRPRDYLFSAFTTKGLPALFHYDQWIICYFPLLPRAYLFTAFMTKGLQGITLPALSHCDHGITCSLSLRPALFPYDQGITSSLPLPPRYYNIMFLLLYKLTFYSGNTNDVVSFGIL